MALRLTERDERILRHVARYRLSTLEVLHRLYFASEGLSLEATKSTLRRFWQDEKDTYLDSKKLYGSGRDVYYHLTPRGAAHLRLPESIGHGFDKHDVRAQHLGRLLFCCGDPPRPKFTLEEFEACFPGFLDPTAELRNRFVHDAYFLDETDGIRRLGRILVDAGGDTMTSARKAVDHALTMLAPFVAARRFTLGIVFPTDAKLRRFRSMLNQTPLEPEVHVVLNEQAALLPLIATGV